MMKKILLIMALSGVFGLSQAQSITFGKIQAPQQFQKYWGLTQEQMKQYENYMQIAGKYRHQNSNPLVVLSIISQDPEDKNFYAAKAAAYEHKMSQAEIESAWLISQEMEKQGLSDAMQTFTDNLTGINTKSYQPKSVKEVTWQDKDKAILIVNKTCLTVSCIKGFLPILKAAPKTVEKEIVIASKEPLDASITQLLSSTPMVVVKKYDAIEHHYLDNIFNRVVQVRTNKVIHKF